MGLAALFVLGVAAAALLWALRLPRLLWAFAGSALMLGATGYALQGSPMLPGRPVAAASTRIEIDPGVIAMRDGMFGRFAPGQTTLAASDALIRFGEAATAAKLLLGAINPDPHNALLWTALGDAVATHDGGLVSPAAMFAFRRALVLAPEQPGPPFFLGLAYVRAGQFADARPLWARALAVTPKDADYRQPLAERLALLDQYLRMMPAQPDQ